MTESDDLYVGAIVDRDQADPSDTLTGDNTEDPLDAGYSPPDGSRTPGAATPPRRRGPASRSTGTSPRRNRTSPTDDIDEEQPRAGRLVAPDEGAHPVEEKDEIAKDVGRAGYAASAEEAAVHIVDE